MENQVQLLKDIANNVDDIKKRLTNIEFAIKEVDMDIHEVRPEYLEKLKKLDNEETISEEEFEKQFGVEL